MSGLKRPLIYPPPLRDGESVVMLNPAEETRKKRNKKAKFKCPEWAVRPSGAVFDNLRLKVDDPKEQSSSVIHLGLKKSHIVGRNERCDIVVNHKSISRNHCALVWDGEQLLIHDLGSTHHTYVNGEALEPLEFVPLREGSVIKFGTHKVLFTVLGTNPADNASAGQDATGDDNSEQLKAMMGMSGFARSKSGRGYGANSAEYERPQEISAEAMNQHRRKAVTSTDGGSSSASAGPMRPPSGPMPAPRSGSKKTPEEVKQARADRVIEQFGLPVTHEVYLQKHRKPVTTIDIDRSGARMASGSLDYLCRIFDFHGMKENKRLAFQELEPHESHGVVEVSYSPSGSQLLVATGSAQPKIYDRDGHEIMTFRKGNYNLSDMARTVGHVSAVTSAHWHPQDANTMITSSTDGTVRTWDMRGKTHFEELLCWQVLKARSKQGRRVGVTRCRWSPDGKAIVAGCQDGSLQLWHQRAKYGLPNAVVRDAHGPGNEVTGLAFDKDGGCKLASRGMDDTMKLWDIRKFSKPVQCFEDLEVVHSGCDCIFSPDGALVVTGTSVDSRRATERGRVVFYDVEGHSRDPVYEVPLGFGESVLSLSWHPILNQILVGTSAGNIVALYNPQRSKKGVLFSVGKHAKKKTDYFSTVDVTGGVILTPNALPMFADPKSKKEQKALDRKDPIKSKKPDFPGTGPTRPDFVPRNHNYTEMMIQQRKKDRYLDKDAREELLKYDAITKANPYWVEPSYAGTQPVKILAKKTAQQEKEDLKKQLKGENASFIGSSELK